MRAQRGWRGSLTALTAVICLCDLRCTVRITRGLPFNASFAGTGMHWVSNSSSSYPILHNMTKQSVAQTGGELVLDLPTLLTTHHVNAEDYTSVKQPYALKQTYAEL